MSRYTYRENKMLKSTTSVDNLETGEKIHQIRQSQVDAINERLNQDSAIIGELGCTIILLLLVCQLFVLLAVVCYSVYQNCVHNSLPIVLADLSDVSSNLTIHG